jgi:nucleotide-binding universal stress UspA family protein
MKNISFQLVNTLQLTRNGYFRDISGENKIPTFAERENMDSVSEAHASTFKKILVPMTLSGSSARSLELARNLARKSGGQLVLLHVVRLNIAGEERGIHRTRLLSDLCRAANYELNQLAALIGDDVLTEVVVSEGRPAEAIVQAAARIGADAIVMSTRPHHRRLKWLHRNTASNVIRQAPCAVILISADKPERERKPSDFKPRRAGKTCVNVINHENPNLRRSILQVLFS